MYYAVHVAAAKRNGVRRTERETESKAFVGGGGKRGEVAAG